MKQRLLGAAVLIALAVIFVPMFLGNSPTKQESVTQSVELPTPPDRKFATRTLPVDGSSPAAAPATTPAEKPAADKPAETAAPAATGDKVVTVDTKAPPTFEAPDTA
ncbi:MAG TPA: SPOR domain-containing protein, partial [Rudaea sp.]